MERHIPSWSWLTDTKEQTDAGARAGDIFFGRITVLVLAGGIACAGSSLLNNYLNKLGLFQVMALDVLV